MKIIDRIYIYLDYKGIAPTKIEKEIGFSNGYLGIQKKRSADIGESILLKFIEYCRDVSLEWLILGNGPMLKSDEKTRGSSGVVPHIDNNVPPQPLAGLKDVIDLATQLGIQIRENELLHQKNMSLLAELESIKQKQERELSAKKIQKKAKKEAKMPKVHTKIYEDAIPHYQNIAAEPEAKYK